MFRTDTDSLFSTLTKCSLTMILTKNLTSFKWICSCCLRLEPEVKVFLQCLHSYGLSPPLCSFACIINSHLSLTCMNTLVPNQIWALSLTTKLLERKLSYNQQSHKYKASFLCVRVCACSGKEFGWIASRTSDYLRNERKIPFKIILNYTRH
jgi:hypothetical protein